MSGVAVHINNRLTKLFEDNEGFEFRFVRDAGALDVNRIAKKDAGGDIKPYAAFSPGEWKSVQYIED